MGGIEFDKVALDDLAEGKKSLPHRPQQQQQNGKGKAPNLDSLDEINAELQQAMAGGLGGQDAWEGFDLDAEEAELLLRDLGGDEIGMDEDPWGAVEGERQGEGVQKFGLDGRGVRLEQQAAQEQQQQRPPAAGGDPRVCSFG